MRQLKCVETSGKNVHDLLADFSAAAGEFGIASESDVVSVTVTPIHDGFHVAIVYWAGR